MPFWAVLVVLVIAFTLGYLLRGSHVNQQAEDYLAMLHARLELAIKRDEAGLRADAQELEAELKGIVHKL